MRGVFCCPQGIDHRRRWRYVIYIYMCICVGAKEKKKEGKRKQCLSYPYLIFVARWSFFLSICRWYFYAMTIFVANAILMVRYTYILTHMQSCIWTHRTIEISRYKAPDVYFFSLCISLSHGIVIKIKFLYIYMIHLESMMTWIYIYMMDLVLITLEMMIDWLID